MERGKLPEIPVPAWPQTATARLTNHPLSNREFLEVPYRRSHIGPPPQPDKPAASLGDYCSAVLTLSVVSNGAPESDPLACCGPDPFWGRPNPPEIAERRLSQSARGPEGRPSGRNVSALLAASGEWLTTAGTLSGNAEEDENGSINLPHICGREAADASA